MYALIVKQYCIKISIKNNVIIFTRSGSLGGGGGWFNIFKTRVKFNQDDQQHRR